MERTRADVLCYSENSVDNLEAIFNVLAILQILLGVYLIYEGILWLAYARKRLNTDPGFYAPRTAVICPCKGVEPGLERNLVALSEFDHQNFELFFVLASETDAAATIIKRVIAQSKVKATLVIAGKPEGCSEKVNNLRAAVQQLEPEFEVLVFVDSDGRPGKKWLHQMVAPLTDSRLGATTTMRWFVPNQNNLPTFLLAAWNAPIVTMLGEKAKNFCWGGGTAIRRSIFNEAGVLEEWQRSASDDYSMTSALERIGRSILFLPECLVVSFADTTFPNLLEFTNRQILITRVYSAKMWGIAFGTHFLFCFTVLLGAILTLQDMIATRPSFHLATLTLLPLLLASIRGALRVVAVAELMPTYRSQINGQSWIYLVLGVFAPFLYLYNFTCSVVSRKIRWRGIRYELVSPQETRILTP